LERDSARPSRFWCCGLTTLVITPTHQLAKAVDGWQPVKKLQGLPNGEDGDPFDGRGQLKRLFS
jgi:hypothetical protein